MNRDGDQNYWDHWMRRRMSRRAMLRRAGLAGLVVAGGSALWACGQSETAKPSGTTAGPTPAGTTAAKPTAAAPTPAVERPKRGGTLRVSDYQNWNILDPHTFYYGGDEPYLRHIFDYLVNYDSTLAYTPGMSLAESWQATDDVTLVFKLRKGVKFTDGTEWNSKVLKFNIDRVATKELKSPRAYALDSVKSIDYPDDYSAKIVLKEPAASFFGEIAHSGFGMVSPANVAKYTNIADLQRNPVGSGPFKLTESVPDDHYTFAANKDFWRKDANGDALPYLDTIRFPIIPDATVRRGNLTTGQIDVDMVVELKDVAAIKTDPNLQVIIQDGTGMSGFYWNMSRAPFTSLNFRKAVQYAINREGIAKAMTFGIAKPYTGVVLPSAAWAYDTKRPVVPYDPVKAKQYLDKAVAEGIKPEFLLYVMSTANVSLCEMIQSDLAKIGIKIDLKVDGTAPNRYWTSFEIDCFYAGYSMSPDPYSKIFVAHHSQGFYTPEKKNVRKDWDTPEGYYAKFDKIIDASNRTYDLKQRATLLNEAASVLDDNAAFVGVYYTSAAMGANKKVQGLAYGGDGRLRFTNAWLKS